VDVCSDLAILGDANWDFELCDLPNGSHLEEAYERISLLRRRLRIATSIPDENKPFRVAIHTVEGKWVNAKGIVHDRLSPFLGLSHKGSLSPGTSGSPNFDEGGDIIGVVVSTRPDDGQESLGVLLASALPQWAIQGF
jgi:hypothetical protein